jgi:hypothetical protein
VFERQPTFVKTGFESVPLQVLHDQIGGAILVADIVQHANVGMVKRGDGAGFLLETPLGCRVIRKVRRQDFDGYGPLQASVASTVHFAHPARTERRLNFV